MMKKMAILTSLIVILGLAFWGCGNPMDLIGDQATIKAVSDDTPRIAVNAANVDPSSIDLIAGRNIDVGDLLVWNDSDTLYLQYNTASSWALAETHLAVAGSLAEIPQTKKGNPIPGKFPYKASHSPELMQYTYEIDLESIALTGGDIIIAAHADVISTDGAESAWAGDCDFPGRNWATYFVHKILEKLPKVIISPNSDLYNEARGIAVDSSGNIYVTGYSDPDGIVNTYDNKVRTIKYNSDGDEVWNVTYKYSNWGSIGYDVAIDDSGNAYVATWNVIDPIDWYQIIKYDNIDGAELWTLPTPFGDNQAAGWAIAVDNAGNIYHAGGIFVGYWKGYLIKRDPDGDELWNRQDVRAFGIALDSAANVYVTGDTGHESTGSTAKYDSSGTLKWLKTVGSLHGTDVAVDNVGDVYVIAEVWGSSGSYDITKRSSSDGSILWGPITYSGDGYGIAIDSSNDVYVTGTNIAKYDGANGNLIWGPESFPVPMTAKDIAIDGSGNVYVTGVSNNYYCTIIYYEQ